ncbi:MAG TPA: response regulator transcription factor [Rariglobus sp.]|jgi:two-component system response regulator DevR|nr:response regulator transcription factor [Rariglobus sp.]
MNTPPSPKAPLRVLMVDDSEVVRMGLRALLSAESSLTIIAEAHNVASAVEAAIRQKPDVVLLDIRLPDGTGFDACRQILHHCPATRVLVLTSVADEDVVDNAIRAGAHGYLLKEVHGRALVQAIHDVAAGKSILDPAITARVLALMRSTTPATRDTLAMLSPQERRVLALIAEGRTNKEVAQEMSLTEKTVKNYLSNIFDKLHVSRRAEAAALYAKGKTAR